MKPKAIVSWSGGKDCTLALWHARERYDVVALLSTVTHTFRRVSMHGVRADCEAAVIDMFNRFILLQAEGGRIAGGQEIRMASLPLGLTCHHAGSLDDPDFNNVHVETKCVG